MGGGDTGLNHGIEVGFFYCCFKTGSQMKSIPDTEHCKASSCRGLI